MFIMLASPAVSILFRCIVSNSAGADTSDEALLEVSQVPIAPTITTQPQIQTVVEEQTVLEIEIMSRKSIFLKPVLPLSLSQNGLKF